MMLLLLVNRRFFVVLAAFVLVFSFGSARASDFSTNADYAVLLDFNTGTILFDKNSRERMAPSSMTKLMTSYIIFDHLKRGLVSMDSTFKVSENAWRKGGSKMFVEHNSEIRLEDLIRGIVVQSGNDACIVVAEGFSGSEDSFAEDMNYMAKKLGLVGSHFVNSTGWPHDDHYVTAYDLALISKHIIEDFPEYYPYFSEKTFTYNNIQQPNRNRLLSRNIGVDGLKTGHTEAAGYGIVVSAEQDGRRLITVINGLGSEKEREVEAQRLIRHGFRDFSDRTILTTGEEVEQAEVWYGRKNSVPLLVSEDVTLLLSRDRNPDLKVSVKYQSPIPAPITKGDHLGDLHVEKSGMKTRVIPLLAGEDVEEISYVDRILHSARYYILRR